MPLSHHRLLLNCHRSCISRDQVHDGFRWRNAEPGAAIIAALVHTDGASIRCNVPTTVEHHSRFDPGIEGGFAFDAGAAGEFGTGGQTHNQGAHQLTLDQLSADPELLEGVAVLDGVRCMKIDLRR